MNQPLVSVVIPAYNHEKFVEATLRSIWDSTYPNVEILVADDGSTDGTAAIVERLQSTSPVPIHFNRQKNVGPIPTLNRLLPRTKGKYVVLFASDDLFVPGRLAKQVASMERQPPSVAGCHGDMEVVDAQGTPTGYTFRWPSFSSETAYLDAMRFQFGPCLQAALIRADALREVGFYDESIRIDDWDIFLRLLRRYSWSYEPGVVAQYRSLTSGLHMTISRHEEDFLKVLSKHLDDPRVKAFGKERVMASLWRHLASGNLGHANARIPQTYAWRAWRLEPLNLPLLRIMALTTLPPRLVSGIRDAKKRLRKELTSGAQESP